MGRGKRQQRLVAATGAVTAGARAPQAAPPADERPDNQHRAEILQAEQLKVERALKRKRAKLVKDNFVGQRGPSDREIELFLPILAHGGDKVVVPYWPDGDLEIIAERGQLFDGDGAYSAPGKPIQCHQNAVYLWSEGQKEGAKTHRKGCKVVTGYALSKDGHWRQHSWCVAANGRPIETTTPRVRYFGVVLTDAEAAQFYALNS